MTFILNVHDNTSELERTSPTDSFITPSLPHWGWATATISQQSSTWTTTYSSYDGSARMFFSTFKVLFNLSSYFPLH